jgi:hypothetical protein
VRTEPERNRLGVSARTRGGTGRGVNGGERTWFDPQQGWG